MRLLQNILALPPSLLLLLVSNASLSRAANDDQSPEQWLYNRPSHIKYFPEDPPHRRRDLEEIQEHILAGHAPVAVKKMSVDENEKFFPEYWRFQDYGNQHAMFKRPSGGAAVNALRKEFEEEEASLLVNASAPLSFRPAFAVHKTQEMSLNKRDNLAIAALGARNAAAALAFLEKRDFQCPGGTSPCNNIAAPNLCCAMGEVCFTIPDTGLGTVGCCPSGANCSGNITCAAGNTPCGSDIGGGCCIPGYVCAGIGCELLKLLQNLVYTDIRCLIRCSSTSHCYYNRNTSSFLVITHNCCHYFSSSTSPDIHHNFHGNIKHDYYHHLHSE